MALTLLHPPSDGQGILAKAPTSLSSFERPEHIFTKAQEDVPASASRPLDESLLGALSAELTLKPGATKTLDFLISWYFPDYNELDAIPVQERTQDSRSIFQGHRRHYAPWFDSAADVAAHITENKTRLLDGTRRWNKTWYDSTLPY